MRILQTNSPDEFTAEEIVACGNEEALRFGAEERRVFYQHDVFRVFLEEARKTRKRMANTYHLPQLGVAQCALARAIS